MTHQTGLIARITQFFRGNPEPRADVWITPYVALTYDDLTEAEVQTRKRIAKTLAHYQDRMVIHHDATSRFVKRLQMIEAYWNTDSNKLQVWGRGDRHFTWSGTLDRFLGTDILLEAAND